VAQRYWGKETAVKESAESGFSDEMETQGWTYLHGRCYQKSSLAEALEGPGIKG